MTDAKPQSRDAQRTRERILTAARREFSRAGFGAVTVRSIAESAGVSPNLITRYFGGKEGLFVACSRLSLGVDRMFEGPRDELGSRMARVIVDRWTAMSGEDPLLALLRASGERRGAAEMLADFLDRESFQPLRSELERYGLEREEAAARARSVDVFLLGVTARHRMLRDELGDPDTLREWLAASIQRLVDGE